MQAACITAKNEVATIGPLVRQLVNQGLFVVAVDDGSSDGTGSAAADAGAHVLHHPVSRRIGPSLMEAWQFALERGCTRIVQIDAGGSHDPGEAALLLARLDDADIVIGSRFVQGGRYLGGRWYRPLLSRVAASACNGKRFGTTIYDWTSGYRAFSERAARLLAAERYQALMHGWQIEVLATAFEKGLRVVEVPITYTAGESSFNRRVGMEALGVWVNRCAPFLR